MRRGAKLTKPTVTKPPVSRKSRKNQDSRVRDLEKRLAGAQKREAEALKREAEAQEQQTATAEILGVISRSPTDVQPVFDTIVRSAVVLCGAMTGTAVRFDGELMHLVAGYNYTLEVARLLHEAFPMRPSPRMMAGRAILSRDVVHVEDALEDSDYAEGVARAGGFRSMLAAPMLRDGRPIGAIVVNRGQPGSFSRSQIELLKTFAAQAVIAVENVRLFTETKDALERQTATSEILRVISTSPTDVQPVFDTIVKSAVRLCDGLFSALYQFDGELIYNVAQHNYTPEALEKLHRVFPARPTRALFTGRVILERAVVHIPDSEVDPEHQHQALFRAIGWRSGLFVPMLREGAPIGVIEVARAEPGPFSEEHIALLKTFADQAVIAIENVRLFKELQTSNRELIEALERQTATSEVLKAISRSTFDLQPVLQTLIENATRLCSAQQGFLFTSDGELHHLAVEYNAPPAFREWVHRHPLRTGDGSVVGRVALEGRVVQIFDAQADAKWRGRNAEAPGISDVRTLLGVPMRREGVLIGVIAMWRTSVRPFTDKELGLIETFADQAVIAIENVRLFTELQEKNRALTQAHAQVSEALDQQTGTSDILRVLSGSPTNEQPVFDAIVRSARRLCDAAFSVVVLTESGQQVLAAVDGVDPARVEAMRAIYPRPIARETTTGRAILDRRIVHIEDSRLDPEYTHPLRDTMELRSILTVPIFREGSALGAVSVWRPEARPFTDKQIALLQTFADQAVIAIENVRLFKELEARTRELTHSVEELRALGEVSQAVSSTLKLETVLATIVSRAVQMSGSYEGILYEFDEATQTFHARATHQITPEHLEALRRTPVRFGEGAVGRAGVIREPVQVADIEAEWQLVAPQVRTLHAREGMRSLLAVPLVREDRLFGGLVILRRARGAFSPEVVDTLRTLAAQSVLAIQNARLFEEIADKSRQLEAASRHKSEFLANMSHELRTPLNAIIGFSEVLMQRMFGALNAKQEEYLKDIYESGRHLLSLINDILDLSKIEAGRMELELTEFDLPTAIDSALTLVRERATRRGIALKKTLDERVGPVHADERKVRQVVVNLLSNAIKFTPEGGRIEIRAVPVDGSVEISVTDTGVGIAPEDHEAVFEEFRQVGASAAKQEGTGLGLALCRKFVELHGGTISVTSAVGAGSTFTFRLPVRP